MNPLAVFIDGPKQDLDWMRVQFVMNYIEFPGIAGRYRLIGRKRSGDVITEAYYSYERRPR